MTSTPPRFARPALGAAAAVLTVVGVVSVLLGSSPLLFAFVLLGAATLALVPRFGALIAVPTALIGLLLVSVVVIRIAPLLGADLGVCALVVYAVLGLAASAAIAMSDPAQPITGGLALSASAIVPALLLVIVFVSIGSGDVMRVGWAMSNDAAWNTVSARIILADDGIAPWSNPNPSPLANGLMALWYAPGRDGAASVLRHDVTRQTELLIASTAVCSLLSALVASRAVPPTQRTLTVVAAGVGGLIPLSWLVISHVIRFGFFNVIPVLAVLCATWLFWLHARTRPAIAIIGLLLSAVVLLGGWAPVAAFPAALAAVAGGRAVWSRRLGIRGWIGVGAATAVLGVYGLVVTVPDLQRSGHALAANGAAPPVEANGALIAAALIVAVSIVTGLRSRVDEVVGLIIIVGVGIAVVAYLVAQRAGLPTAWGYYPVKFAWIVCVFLVMIGTGAVFAVAAASRGHWGRLAVAGASAVAVLAAAFAIALPPGRSIVAVLPFAGFVESAVDPAADHSPDARADALFALADGGRTIVARWSADPSGDGFVNFWLLQLHSSSSEEAIRGYAYFLDSDDPEDVCAAASTWDAEVRVVTGDARLAEAITDECGDLPLSIEVSYPDAVASGR